MGKITDLLDKLEGKEEVKGQPEVSEPVVEESSDRSAYNCPDCMGEGMIFNAAFPEGKICLKCAGTGKV